MTGFRTPGFTAIENFYESLQWSNPPMALIMHADLMAVSLGGISGDRSPHYPALLRLRSRAMSLPMPMSKILDYALEELGYSLLHAAEVAADLSSRKIHPL